MLRGLKQLLPTASTETSLFDGTQTESYEVTIDICNQDTLGTTFQIRHRLLGAPTDTKQFLYYDRPVGGNETIRLSPIGLSPGDILTVYTPGAYVAFHGYVE